MPASPISLPKNQQMLKVQQFLLFQAKHFQKVTNGSFLAVFVFVRIAELTHDIEDREKLPWGKNGDSPERAAAIGAPR